MRTLASRWYKLLLVDKANRCMRCARSRRYQQPSSHRPGADRHFLKLQDPLSWVQISREVERTVVQLSQPLLQCWQVQMALFARVEGGP
jgi:hypothetical protein